MRHPLNFLLRIGRADSDRTALLGDLEESYRAERRQGRSWPGAQRWYLKEIFTAVACAMRDGAARPRLRTSAMSDVRYALRRWRRRPAFAATAILTLALGIAAATATFSIVDAVLLRPLPWKDPETLMLVYGVYPERRSNPATGATWNKGLLSYLDWDALRRSATFDDVAAWFSSSRLDLTLGEERHEIARYADVSANFLPMLGYDVVLGRNFGEPEDAAPLRTILLSYESWQRHFGGRQDIVGRSITLGSASAGETYRSIVVGVVEPGFEFEGVRPDLFRPIGITAQVGREYPTSSLRLIGRLAPGVTPHVAGSAAAAIVSATLMREPHSARVVPLADEHLGPSRKPLWLMFGGAGLLLLIACANVAGLLLGEARVRRHEIAVRAAIGGSRRRLARQLVIEHLMLAAVGIAVGLAIAAWLIGGVVALAPDGVPRIDTVRVDLRAAWFAVAAGFSTLLIFGVGPALALARTPVAQTLAEGGRDGALGRYLGQRTLVAAEIALALVLLTGAGLFGETILRLTSRPLGFDPHNVAVIATTFTGHRWGDPAQVGAIRQREGERFGQAMERRARETSSIRNAQVFESLAAIPGLTAVAASNAVPFVTTPTRVSVVLETRPSSERHDALQQTVSDAYFATMRVSLLRGRLFGASDVPADERAVVVSREFERRFFPSGALNRSFRTPYGAAGDDTFTHYRIVGVVENVKRQEFADDDRPAFYLSDRQSGAQLTHFVVRAAGEPLAVLPAVRTAINSVTPQLVVSSMMPLEDRIARSVAEERFRAMLSSLFGATALVLAAIGLYGLIARRAADRRREFGVRMALGARPAHVRSLVVRDAGLLIVAGLAIGLPAAYAAAQITRSLLYGVESTSLHVFALSSGVLALVALVATLLPARRASHADPIAALRS